MKKLKKFQETSRGGRRQVLIKPYAIRSVCERVARETGHPFQAVFDELMTMFEEQHVFGQNTQDQLFKRIIEKTED